MKLWEEDFLIDNDIIGLRVSSDVNKQIDILMNKLYGNSTPPEGDSWVCWIDAQGNMHINKEK